MTSHAPVVTQAGTGVRITLRVVPRSSRAEVGGVREGRLLVRVTAAPVDNAANDAVIEALARRLDVPKRAVTLVAGAASRNKIVEVAGVTAARAEALLGE